MLSHLLVSFCAAATSAAANPTASGSRSDPSDLQPQAPAVAADTSELLRGTPNVLYLVSDDLRPEFAAAYNQTRMVTPNVDR